VTTMTVAQPRARKFIRDVRAVFVREFLLIVRDPITMGIQLFQPLIFLVLFAPLLIGSMAGEMRTGATLQWFVPGVIVMISLFGTTMAGSNLLHELLNGSYERILATPLDRSAILVGRSLKEFAPLMAQGLLIALLSLPFGFVLHPVQLLIGLGLLAIFGIGIGALSMALALATKDREWVFWTTQNALLFPLLILSGMMLPLETGPGWMQTASRLNPLTYIVEAERDLLSGEYFSPAIRWGWAAAALVCLIGLIIGIRKTQRTI